MVHPAVGDPGWTEYDKDKYTVFLYTKETISVALALGKLLRLSCDMLAQEWAECTVPRRGCGDFETEDGRCVVPLDAE